MIWGYPYIEKPLINLYSKFLVIHLGFPPGFLSVMMFPPTSEASWFVFRLTVELCCDVCFPANSKLVALRGTTVFVAPGVVNFPLIWVGAIQNQGWQWLSIWNGEQEAQLTPESIGWASVLPFWLLRKRMDPCGSASLGEPRSKGACLLLRLFILNAGLYQVIVWNCLVSNKKAAST